MRKLTQRVTGFILLLAMIAAIVLVPVPMHAHAATTAASTVNASSTAVANIQDGVTLHCWNWSFKNIEANMADIAAAGYTAVQTSPIQQCKEGTVGSTVGHWWVYYQPASFVIDNTGSNALGNKAEFASMCAAAEKYGIKVIVDVVANHLGNQSGNDLASTIPADIRNDTSCWHNIKINTSNYNDRYDITQHCMAGLPDLNTGNMKIQNYVLNFLKECVDAGADGFRFDAAKHIETPEDSGCASDFWPTVINGIKAYKPDVYVYGEVLDGTGGVAMTAYTKYMSVTDNNWGNNLRNNINNGNANGFYHTYDKGVSADKIVLWAESHDTWANDDHQSTYVSETNINKTWAIVAARADAMGLYFARPKSTTQKLGEASKTAWYWKEVAEVNKFHNAFVGQGEYTTKENGYVAIERGTTGVVIVNVSGSGDVNMSVSKLANGTYTDQISGNTFTVSNGRITGKITHQCGYAVIYNACNHNWVKGTTTKATCDTDGVTTYSCSSCGMTKTEVVEVAPGHKYVNDVCSVCGQAKPKGITLYFDNTSNWSTVNIYYWSEADEAMVTWPGVAMTSEGDGIYSYTAPVGVTNVIFNNGTEQTDDLTVPGNNYLYSNGKWEPYVSCSHPSHNTDGICTSCGKATAHTSMASAPAAARLSPL